MTFVEMASMAAEAVVEDVAARLLAQGAVAEAMIVVRLQGDELDLLLLREAGWGMDLPTADPQPVHTLSVGASPERGRVVPRRSPRCGSIDPQAARGSVAA